MKRFRFALLASLVLASCAGSKTAPSTPTDKDFEVPTNLADQFAVKESNTGVPIAPPPPPAPPPTEEKPGAAKGKPEAKKAAKKAKKTKMKADTSTPEKKVEAIPNRWQLEPFFVPGEHYKFDITYFGATAGELELDILPTKVVANRNTFHLRALARTSSVFSLFYRMNDVAESFVDTEGLFSHKFSLRLDESLQERDVLELYDQRKHKVYYWSKLDHKKKGKKNDQYEIEIPPFTQDSVSAFFFVRTLPLKVGESYEFPVSTNGKLKVVRVEAVGRETIKTKIGEIAAIKVKPEVVLEGVLKSYGDSFVWISDDPRRIILKVDAKIKVGSIIGYLREYRHGAAGSEAPKP